MDSSIPSHPSPPVSNPRTHGHRFITLYDAVASLATSKGFYNHPQGPSSSTSSYRPPPIGADEILGRKSVTRHSHSSNPQEALIPYPDTTTLATLPSSELLKAIHQYATERYHSWGLPGEKGMDETALVAVGMLVEEAVREVVVLKGAGAGAGAGAFMEEKERCEEEADVEDMIDGEIKEGGTVLTQSEILRSRSKKRKRAKDKEKGNNAGLVEGLEKPKSKSKSKSKFHSGKEKEKKKRNKRKRNGNSNEDGIDGDLDQKTKKRRRKDKDHHHQHQ